MSRKDEFKRLGDNLEEDNELISFLEDMYDFSLLFSDIEELKKSLIKFHDCLVDIHNKGVDKYRKEKQFFKGEEENGK